MAYSPALNLTTSAGLAHLQMVYYRKRGLDRLQKKFEFRQVTSKDMLPKASGRTVQFYRYGNLSAATTAATEGATGTSGTFSSNVLQATVSQYTAFITVSDLLQDTALDPIVQNAAELLGYQAGLSVDTITRGIIDAESGSTAQTVLSTYLRVADLRNARHQLQASDVQPFEDGDMIAITHPFTSYDVVNDPAAGGLGDIFKYTDPKSTALVKYEDRGVVTRVGGCKLIENTNVYDDSGSPASYRTYVFGKGGVGSVDLEGRGPSEVNDPSKQRFKINVIPGGLSIANPEGTIGAAVSYNFVFTAVVLDGPTGIGGAYRYKTIDCVSSIG